MLALGLANARQAVALLLGAAHGKDVVQLAAVALLRSPDLIAKGKSNKLIGRELDIAKGTVTVHVKHLLKKLNLRSRAEAAILAVEQKRKAYQC